MRHRLLLIPLVLLWGAWNPFLRQVPEVRHANDLLKAKDYPAAETGFKAALERRASEPKLKYNLGLTYLGQNNYTAAESEFISATSSDFSLVRARGNFFLGVTRFHLAETLQQPEEKIGKYKEAADNFRRVLEIESDNEEARHNLEMALERIEDVEKDQEEQKKQQEQKEKQQQDPKDQKDQDQQNKDQQNKDQQNKDQQNKDQQNKDQQNKDQQNKDQQNKDQQNKDQQNKDQQNKDQQNKDQQNKDQQNKDQQNKDQQNKDQQNKDQQNPDQQNPDPQQQPQGKPESPEVKAAKRALDDLKERQKQRILEMHRKGGQGRRAPIKDW